MWIFEGGEHVRTSKKKEAGGNGGGGGGERETRESLESIGNLLIAMCI